MSSVGEKETSEVGGLQGVFQNLGSSLGTALIGSVLIASLSASFLGAVEASDLPDAVKAEVSVSTESGVGIVPVSSVDQIMQEAGLSSAESAQLTSIYGYLEQRFGYWSYKTGSAFFLLSRTLGSAARM
ncbi:MAG: hypothetical protein LH624_08535, partial [Cryobacterium sp.]|nr:hypothetical protein [Cryobacterium sp.]